MIQLTPSFLPRSLFRWRRIGALVLAATLGGAAGFSAEPAAPPAPPVGESRQAEPAPTEAASAAA